MRSIKRLPEPSGDLSFVVALSQEVPMPHTALHKETLVLDLLDRAGCLTVEQLAAALPELTWSELFLTIDSLSRSGALLLRRSGSTYEIRAHRAKAGRSQ